MPGFPPLVKDRWNQPVAANSNISCPDDQIMDDDIIEAFRFVGIEPGVLVMPLIQHAPDACFHELWEITHDEPGVFTRQVHLTTEGKVVADKHAGTRHHTNRERLV